MEDEEENEERSEDSEEEEEDRALRTYSKKKYFGKTTSDLKLLRLRTSIRFRKPALKVPPFPPRPSSPPSSTPSPSQGPPSPLLSSSNTGEMWAH